jgi:hypothetical protein
MEPYRDIDLADWFEYHPVMSDERKKAHEEINEAALKFAKVIQANVKQTDCQKMAFFAIQQARMFANQGATFDEITGVSQSDS